MKDCDELVVNFSGALRIRRTPSEDISRDSEVEQDLARDLEEHRDSNHMGKREYIDLMKDGLDDIPCWTCRA